MGKCSTYFFYFQVSLTGHRYIEVVHPLYAYRICKVGLVTKQYMIIIATAICIDLPRYFELKLIKHNNSYVYLSQTSLHDNSIYQLVFKTIFVMTVRLLLPIILIVIFTFALGHAIFKTRRKIAALARKRISVEVLRSVQKAPMDYSSQNERQHTVTV